MGADDLDAETLKRLKREAAIRSKEQDFERRKKAEERKKREQLQALREEYEAQQTKREQERLSLLRKNMELKARKKEENDRLNQTREKNIKKRHTAWRARADAEIQHIKEDQAAEEERLDEAIQAARQRKADRQDSIRQEKMDKQTKQEELEMTRAEAEIERSKRRDLRAIDRVDQLKMEARDELESFIQNPYPVPLKQVLAGRLRPVPTVTELLAAYKDQREDLEQLEKEDIPMRAQLCNQSIFQYVRDIQMKAEAERMRPPEPVAGDLLRTVGKKKQAPTSPVRRNKKNTRN